MALLPNLFDIKRRLEKGEERFGALTLGDSFDAIIDFIATVKPPIEF